MTENSPLCQPPITRTTIPNIPGTNDCKPFGSSFSLRIRTENKTNQISDVYCSKIALAADPKANALISDFIARKIRQRVKDPAVADKLIPKNHGFGTRRVPLETRYFEAYNRDNVQLVDINETPIERVTLKGIKTSNAEYEFDMIIYATGFDAITGAFDRIDFRGIGGEKLKDKWADGPKTFLGLQSAGFSQYADDCRPA